VEEFIVRPLAIIHATRPGDPPRPSEDRCAAVPDEYGELMVVIDGVTTSAPGAPVLGGAYADVLLREILEAAADRTVPLTKAIATAIVRAGAQFSLGLLCVPGRTPQATVAVVRRTGDTLEAAVIGDCTVTVLLLDGRHIVLTDDRLHQITSQLPARIQQFDRLRQGEGTIGDDVDRDLLQQVMSHLTSQVNRPGGGYWIAAGDPEAALQARTSAWYLPEVSEILLTTDGASRLVDLHATHTWPQVLDLCRIQGPETLLDAVTAADAADPHGQAAPRTKRSDDKSALFARVTTGAAW
jgi:hypothetical protein